MVVLSDALWRSQFHADPAVLGRTVRLNDDVVVVVGVMPRGFFFPVNSASDVQLWQPASLADSTSTQDFRQVDAVYGAVGRRARGSSEADVTRELTAIQQTLVPQMRKSDQGAFQAVRIVATDYRKTLDSNQREAMLALSGAVALLWLIGCADVASLLLARVTAKRREFAVRSSLGASRWRVTRGMLAEVALLTAGGALLGLLLGQGLLLVFERRLVHLFGNGLPLHPDGLVLLGLVLLSLVSAVVLTAIPLWFAVGGSLEASLRADGSQAGKGLNQGRLQRHAGRGGAGDDAMSAGGLRSAGADGAGIAAGAAGLSHGSRLFDYPESPLLPTTRRRIPT